MENLNQSNIIQIIDFNAKNYKEYDIENLIDDLITHFTNKINYLSIYVYGQDNKVGLDAFKEHSKNTFRNCLRTFILDKEYWKDNRSIGPYLSNSLTKLANTLKSVDNRKKIVVPVCPACKTLGQKEFLVYDGKILRCNTCFNEVERLELLKTRTSGEEYEYRIRKIFSLHSRKGYKCPECERFIPDSYIMDNIRVSCPYDNCTWFGMNTDLDLMSHPMGQSSDLTLSLNFKINSFKNLSKVTFQDYCDAGEINPDIKIDYTQKYINDLKVVQDVISTQKNRLALQPNDKVFKKRLMYQAFQNLLEKDSVGMLNYLLYGKSLGERPIQSLIFQEYISLIENKLPLELKDENGNIIDIYSLLDPNLNLFLGKSEYNACVRNSGIIPNNTHEIFIGSKCNGPCFIGLLCDVNRVDNNESILSEVEYYSFSNIKLKSNYNLPKNCIVKVSHFRIPPHYEMYSLVLLQRVRRKIVDSIHKRLYGEKRSRER